MYSAAALLPAIAIASVMRLWRTGLDVPFVYSADSLLTGAVVKGILRNGWWLENASLGAPGTMNMFGMPGADSLFYLEIRLLGLFSNDWAVVINIFYLVSYALAGLTAAFALRRLRFSRLTSVCGAVLFAMLPYHWMRGEAHLFLSSYWIVPLFALVAFWMASDRTPLVADAAPFDSTEKDTRPRWRWDVRSKRSLMSIGICIIGGATGVYYAFFGAAFILIVGIRRAVQTGRIQIVAAGLALVAIIGVVAVAQAAPNVVLARETGTSTGALSRSPIDAEVYGLKLTQLFLPIDNHRVAKLAAIKAAYRKALQGMGPYLNNESNAAALGVLGSLGFIASLIAFLFRGRRHDDRASIQGGSAEVLVFSGFLNLSAVLLATVGGFGAIIAVLLPEIRAYNRISVFVGFFSLVALAVFADHLRTRGGAALSKMVLSTAIVVLTFVGVLDQTPSSLQVSAQEISAYHAEESFGRTVQAAFPSATSVLQLPYMPFPEPGGPVGQMQDYEPLRAYLQVDGLRWSYGAMKGGSDDAWQKAVAVLPPEQLIAEARAQGFDALWVQLNGYADGGVSIAESLTELLGSPVVIGRDGTVAVWRL